MKLSKEAMRAARLRAMGLSADESGAGVNEGMSDGFKEKKQLMSDPSQDAPSFEHVQLDPRIWKLLSDGGSVVNEDMSRWLKQGFSFSDLPEFPLGLKQGQGGPCGVLAAVQAELLIQCLFLEKNAEIDDKSIRVDKASLQKAFIASLTSILDRAKSGSTFAIVEPTADIVDDIQMLSTSLFRVLLIPSVDSLKAYLSTHIRLFFSNVGCLLFLISLVCTRGIDVVHSDMDNPEHTLIGMFLLHKLL